MLVWNAWHGCHKKSPGCLNCYMFRRDSEYGLDSNVVNKTKSFKDAIRKRRDGSYFIKKEDGDVYICLTSDFFIEEADEWRKEIWQMADERLPILLNLPIKHREIIHEPMLERINIEKYLASGMI